MKDGERTIGTYKETIALVQKEAYVTTAFLFMELLKEEYHHDTFTTLLEQIQNHGTGELGFSVIHFLICSLASFQLPKG